jgi:asparagine synthase (glutamine-hydrolysing)
MLQQSTTSIRGTAGNLGRSNYQRSAEGNPMSGVVGWIDFSRDLVRQRSLLIALAGTMAPRGPDAEDVWVSPRAALGFRALQADATVGSQPYVRKVGEADVAVCVTGAPMGLMDLRARLRAPASTPVAELFALAYLKSGTDFIPELGGTFAIVIWDGRTEELFLARDQVGGQPIYYTNTATGLVFASERKALLAHPEVTPAVDAAGLREAISHALPTGALYSGFSSIAPAEIARFSRAGWSRRKYWQLASAVHTDDEDTTVAAVRAMLRESIAAQVPADASQLVATLSGGIDSSAVAGLAAAELVSRGSRQRLRTFTVDFTDPGEFQPDVMRDTKDAPYAQAVADRINSAHTLVELEAVDILDPVVQLGLLRAKDVPTRIYDMDASQYLFIQRVAEQGGRIAFTGGAGDQLFQGARWSTDKTLVESGTFPWLAMAQRFGAVNGFGTGLLSPEVIKALDFPSYYADAYSTAIGEVEYLPGEDEWQRHMRRVSYLVLTRGPIDSSVFAAAGLQLRSPINYHKLIQYAYNIPTQMHTRGGIEKGILRAAVADLLPQEVLSRRQSATPVSNHPAYTQRLQQEMKAILGDPQAPVRSLIDVTAATELVDQPMRLAKDRLARAAVELTLQLNLWLDQYRVRLVI